MHRVLVDEKKWISEERFLHALNYCMLLPGPEAQQLATYIGWTMHGLRGAIVAANNADINYAELALAMAAANEAIAWCEAEGLVRPRMMMSGNGAQLWFALPAAALVWLYTMLSFAPVAVVLERKPVFAALPRSFALVRTGFWRVLGIRLLAAMVAGAVATAVSVPFAIVTMVVASGTSLSTAAVLLAATSSTIGSIIGQIITTPFSAGVDTLLYTDRRIRAEAFDLVLRSGAVNAIPGAGTDQLWLTGP